MTRIRASKRWRMLYTSRWKPYTLFVLESDDGIRFRSLPCDDIVPEGQKHAANHIFTLRDGSCGGVYLDPVAADVEEGAVLVAPATDPSWVPLLLKAGALIVD